MRTRGCEFDHHFGVNARSVGLLIQEFAGRLRPCLLESAAFWAGAGPARRCDGHATVRGHGTLADPQTAQAATLRGVDRRVR
jgi:hypothetical protein